MSEAWRSSQEKCYLLPRCVSGAQSKSCHCKMVFINQSHCFRGQTQGVWGFCSVERTPDCGEFPGRARGSDLLPERAVIRAGRRVTPGRAGVDGADSGAVRVISPVLCVGA